MTSDARTADQTPPPPPVGGGNPDPKREANLWAMGCHLSALAGYVVTVPFAGVLGPLVVWLIKKDEYPEVQAHGKAAINFQLSMAIYSLISIPLVLVVIGIFLLVGLAVLDLICVILAGVKAADGQTFRYPLSIQFLR